MAEILPIRKILSNQSIEKNSSEYNLKKIQEGFLKRYFKSSI